MSTSFVSVYAFFVQEKNSGSQHSVPTDGETLTFSTIVSLNGGGYDAATGKYRIQKYGNYVFTFNVVSMEGIVLITLKDSEGTQIVQQFGKSVDGSIEAITGTVVIARNPGIEIFLHVQPVGTGKIMLDRCWFAGWLQNAYEPTSAPP